MSRSTAPQPDSGDIGLPAPTAHTNGELREVAALFSKLGLIAFGGPAAHIALMRQEAVERRGWLSDQQFLDLVGAANLIPGPSSTELAIFLGYRRAGWRGLVLAGVLFILPAMLIVMALAWAYVRFGATPAAGGLLYGIKPVIIAVIAVALWGLGKTAVKSVPLAVVGIAVLGLYFMSVSPIILLFGGALVVLLVENAGRLWEAIRSSAVVLLPTTIAGDHTGQHTACEVSPLRGSIKGSALLGRLAHWASIVAAAVAPAAVPFSMATLFLVFLKIGAVIYGSGYVLLAFLQTDLVNRLGWLTDQQLIDAVAVGQFTPGPVFTTATFIGYVLGGWGGALLATLGIFLPSFVFVALVYPFVPRLRGSPWMRGFLDGANVAALGLMAAVAWQLGRAAIVDPLTAALALIALALLMRYKVNSAWLVLGGAAVGIAHFLLG
jgi:chromate transporter